jgi:hypothetical protein
MLTTIHARFLAPSFRLLVLVILALSTGCSTKLDVNAPYKELYAVYGVLNPQLKTNYVRVAKVFQTGSDLFVYAGQEDLNIKNATVTLTESGSNIVITLVEIDTLRQPGAFNPNLKIFGTNTPILPGRSYTLKVYTTDTVNGVPELRILATSKTTVPSKPAFNTQDTKQLGGAPPAWPAGNVPAYQAIQFENSFLNRFYKEDPFNLPAPAERKPGIAFESRIYFNGGYLDANNDTIFNPEWRFGPTRVFNANLNKNCSPVSADLCYSYSPFEYIAYLNGAYGSTIRRVYDASFLSKAIRVEVTAIDTFLFNYMQANSISFTDFTTIRPEYTNILAYTKTGQTQPAVGVFGSINIVSRFVRMSPCTEYLVQLNGRTVKPDINCELPQ